MLYEAGVVAGALTCALFDPYSVVVGASGGVYCIYGVHIANLLLNWSEMRHSLFNFKVRLFLLLAFNAYEFASATVYGTDGFSYSAHLGGWFCGVALGLVALHDVVHEHVYQRVLKRGAALLFGAYALVAIGWFWAHFPTQFVTTHFTIRGISDVPCCWTALWCNEAHPDAFARSDFEVGAGVCAISRVSAVGADSLGARRFPRAALPMQAIRRCLDFRRSDPRRRSVRIE